MRHIAVPCVAFAVLALAALHPASVSAKPLSADECKARVVEHADLVSKGAGTLAEKDPDWVKANMTEEDLTRVRRLIEVEDDIRFRCPGVEIASVTPGQLLGKKTDDNDEAEGDRSGETQTVEKSTKTKPDKALSGPDIPLPLRKPSPPRRAENLRFERFGQIGQN